MGSHEAAIPYHHHHHLELKEVLAKFSTAIKQMLGNSGAPPIGPGSIPSVTPESLLANIVRDLDSQGMRVPQDLGILISLLQTAFNHGLVDDKKFLVERVVKLAASLPDGSTAQKRLSGLFIGTLWDNLRHPPLSYLGEEFKYRMADGSNNNIMYPQLGKAGSSYARSVTPVTQLPAVLPDASVIFDALFAREGSATEHPSKISSVLFYQASIIIHDVFRTSDMDPNRVNSSSYLDLSPLYGANQNEQNKVRTFQNGTLKPDAFAEIRLLGFPPGVAALLVCYNRFHNYVVSQLAEINEGGRFNMPAEGSHGYDAALLKRDNDLFQTGRLVTCGLYVNIILGDYVRTILNLNRSNSTWSLDPRETFDDVFNMEGTPSGIGNQVSVEFNLIYRWHSTVSNKDEKWTKEFYNTIFPGKDPNTLSMPEFQAGLRAWVTPIAKQDPGERTFGGLKRTQNGSGPFEDSDLMNLLTESIEDVAGAFGARNVPAILKAVDILGIEQGRKWKVATLNEFRKFFKLQPYASFEQINSDKDVAQSLETLYVHPDYVELYPGLVAEEAKPVAVPGSGLCPGYTIATSILSDAVSLVRGDRFYTVDYGTASLTNWGFNEVSYNSQIAGGGVMYKLLMRAFPGWFRGNSVYAMFPFTVPEENRVILSTLGKEKDYDFAKPSFVPQPQAITTWKGVVSVLDDTATFKVPWGPHTYYLTKRDYMLSGDSPANTEQKEFVHNAIYDPKHDSKTELRHVIHKAIRDARHDLKAEAKEFVQNAIYNLHNDFRPEVEESMPNGVEKDSVTNGEEKDSVSNGNQQESAPTGGQMESAPNSEVRESVPNGIEKETLPNGDAKESAPSEDVKESVSNGVVKESIPNGDVKESTPNGDVKEPVPKTGSCHNHCLGEIRQFYETLTTNLVKQQSHKLRNIYTLDAVRDVGNTSHAQFIAHLFHIPIQGPSHPLALMTDQELYTLLALLFAFVFLDLDSAKSFGLRAAAAQGTDALMKVMKGVCTAVMIDRSTLNLDILGMLTPEHFLKQYGTQLISRLFAGGKSVDEVISTIIPTAAAAVATQAQGLAQMLDLYLSDKYYETEWPKIQKLAESDTDEDFELLKKYALEGYRLATPAFGLLRKVETDATVQDGERTVNVRKGDQVFVDFVSACIDPTVFPDPLEVKLDRPDESYIHHGYGSHACLGRPIVVTAMAAQLKVFARLKGLRRAPGLQGQLKSKTVNGAFKVFMKEDWSDWWPFPATMKVHFDGFGE